MCTMVTVKTDQGELDCSTVGELADALGAQASRVRWDMEAETNDCLCDVDLSPLAARRTTDAEGYPHPSHIIDIRSEAA